MPTNLRAGTSFSELCLGHVYLDVRAPAEFAAGAMPGATNLPILSDEERRRVGTCYKNRGRDAAIALGHALVSDDVKAARIATWRAFAEQWPNANIYCARGGLRSHIAAEWLANLGVHLERIEGGYKSLRNQCLQALETIPGQLSPIVLGGRTGSGKTKLIREQTNAIDIEGLARHRGSAFGALRHPQPSQATFENHLAQALCAFETRQRIVIEDESRAIGSRSVPNRLYESMGQAPLVVVEQSREARAARIYDEYIVEAAEDMGFQALQTHYAASLQRISKRLGGTNCAKIGTALERAFEDGSREAHLVWIGSLLERYYDPMYDHGLKRKAARICFRGTPDAIREWLKTQIGTQDSVGIPATPRESP